MAFASRSRPKVTHMKRSQVVACDKKVTYFSQDYMLNDSATLNRRHRCGYRQTPGPSSQQQLDQWDEGTVPLTKDRRSGSPASVDHHELVSVVR